MAATTEQPESTICATHARQPQQLFHDTQSSQSSQSEGSGRLVAVSQLQSIQFQDVTRLGLPQYDVQMSNRAEIDNSPCQSSSLIDDDWILRYFYIECMEVDYARCAYRCSFQIRTQMRALPRAYSMQASRN